jgi:hypothetical protein
MAGRVGGKQALADAVAASYVVGWRLDSLDQRLATARELAHVATEMGDAALEALARNLIVTNLLQRGEIDGAERELAALNRPIGTAPTALAQMGRGRSASQARTRRGTAQDYEALAHEAHALGLEGPGEIETQGFVAQMLLLRGEQGRSANS